MNAGTIIVGGALANKAGHGGEAWVRLNWVLGFQALGFRVLFLEEIAGQPDWFLQYILEARAGDRLHTVTLKIAARATLPAILDGVITSR